MALNKTLVGEIFDVKVVCVWSAVALVVLHHIMSARQFSANRKPHHRDPNKPEFASNFLRLENSTGPRVHDLFFDFRVLTRSRAQLSSLKSWLNCTNSTISQKRPKKTSDSIKERQIRWSKSQKFAHAQFLCCFLLPKVQGFRNLFFKEIILDQNPHNFGGRKLRIFDFIWEILDCQSLKFPEINPNSPKPWPTGKWLSRANRGSLVSLKAMSTKNKTCLLISQRF